MMPRRDDDNTATGDTRAGTGDPRASRATTLILTGVIGVAAVGFFVGTNHRREEPVTVAAPRSPTPAPEGVQPTITYAEVGKTRLGPNAGWTTRIDELVQEDVDLFAIEPADPAVKLASLADRATRRAYNGAPPVIPHSIDQLSSASCLACHERAMTVGDRSASKMPHPFHASCTQCHVQAGSDVLSPFVLARNSFRGLPAPFEGPRAGPGAPPVIPHSTLMRTDCQSCHGPRGPAGLHTTHPWRLSCTQCHAPSAELDQYAQTDRPTLLPGPVVRSQ